VRKPEVVIVSGSLGGGHDAVANELARRLLEIDVHARVIDYLDRLPRAFSAVFRSGYYAGASHAPQVLEVMFRSSQGFRGKPPMSIKMMARTAARRLLPDISEAPVVVSTFPFATQSLGYLRERGLRAVTAGYLTDPAAHRLWMHPAVDHHLTVTDATVASVRSYGFAATAVGPLVGKDFRRAVSAEERDALRAELDVDPSQTLALLMCGVRGIGSVRGAAEDVRKAGALPVVVCGRNEQLRLSLQARGIRAVGWRQDVYKFMHAADVLVHNSGGLSFTESLVVGLPAITYLPIAGHGRLNAKVLDESGLSPWAHSIDDLRAQFGRLATRERIPFAESGETATAFVASLCTSSLSPAS